MADANRRFCARKRMAALAAALFAAGAQGSLRAAADVPDEVRQEIVTQSGGCYAVNHALGAGNDFSTSDDDEMRNAARTMAGWYEGVFREYSGLSDEEATKELWTAANDLALYGFSEDTLVDMSIYCSETFPPLLERWEGYERPDAYLVK